MKKTLFAILMLLLLFSVSGQESVVIDPAFFIENYKTRMSATDSIGNLLNKYFFYTNFDVFDPFENGRYLLPVYETYTDQVIHEECLFYLLDFVLFVKIPLLSKWIPGVLLYAQEDDLTLALGGDYRSWEFFIGGFLEYYKLFRLTLGSYSSTGPVAKLHSGSGQYYLADPDEGEGEIDNLHIQLNLLDINLQSLIDFEIMEILYFAISYGFKAFDFDIESFLYYYNLLQKITGSLGLYYDFPERGMSYGGKFVLSSELPFFNSACIYGTLPVSRQFFVKGGLSYLLKHQHLENLMGFSFELGFNYNDKSNHNYLSIGLSRNYSQDFDKWPVSGDLTFHFKVYSAFKMEDVKFLFGEDGF